MRRLTSSRRNAYLTISSAIHVSFTRAAANWKAGRPNAATMGSIHACSRPSISRYSALAAALDPNNRSGRLSVGIKADVIGRVAVEVRRRPLAYKEKRCGRREFALRRFAARGQLEIRGVRNPIGIPEAVLPLDALEVDVARKGVVPIRGHGLVHDEVRRALPRNTFTIAWIENGARDRHLAADG